MKKLIPILLLMAISFNTIAQNTKSNSKKYYYRVGYFAHAERDKFCDIYEQKLVVTKERPQTFTAKLTKQYVDFIKKNHPEYFLWHVSGLTDQKQIDFAIKAQAKIDWSESEKETLKVMGILMAERQEKHDKNPDLAPVIKVNEFTYKEE